MKIIQIAFALGLMVIATSATAQIKKVLADKIIATVGDKYILRSDIDNAIADYKRQAQGQEKS
jgi:peptidyl-prolyl cis-trans isomerase SurA